MNDQVDIEAEYQQLLFAVRDTYGYDFTNYALPSVKRRIEHCIGIKRIVRVPELTLALQDDPGLAEEFIQHLSITVTEMFRDPHFYKMLRTIIVNQLATYPVIKIWVAGCATGQEVFSLGIILHEEDLLRRSIVYATDINQQSLQHARQGIYSLQDMKMYTQNYLEAGGKDAFSKYYSAKHGGALFDRDLISNVVFSPHNLAVDGSFNEFQLIICRNVLMYFNRSLQDRVVKLFSESLCNLGYLGIGDKESLLFSMYRDHFQETHRKEKIYRKIK